MTSEAVQVRNIKQGDIIFGWADGTQTIRNENGSLASSFRGRVTDITHERIDRPVENGGPYDAVVKISVESLTRDARWTVEPFLSVSQVYRET